MTKLVFFLLTLFCCAAQAAPPMWFPAGSPTTFVDLANIKRLPNGAVNFWWKEVYDKGKPVAGTYPPTEYKVAIAKATIYCSTEMLSVSWQTMFTEPDMQVVAWDGPMNSAPTPVRPGSVMGIAMEDVLCASKPPGAKTAAPAVPNYLMPIDPQAKNRQAP